MTEQKINVGELKAVCIMLKVIPVCQVLGFEADCEIDDLAEEAKKLYEYEVRKIQKKVRKRVNELRDLHPESSKQELNSIIQADAEIKGFTQEEIDLMNSEVDFKFEPIELPVLDYSLLFGKEKIEIEFMGQEVSLKPYNGFIELRRKGIITFTKK